MKRIYKIIIALLIAFILAALAGYFFALKSDAYRAFVDFAEAAPLIKEKIGPNPNLKLDFFGYSIKFSGPTGYAEFSSSISGDKGSGKLYGSLTKEGQWRIKSMTLNGEAVTPLN